MTKYEFGVADRRKRQRDDRAGSPLHAESHSRGGEHE